MNPITFVITVTLLILNLACSQTETASPKQSPAQRPKGGVSSDSGNPCIQFDKVNTLIRDGSIAKEIARNKITELLPRIRDYYYAKGGTDSAPDMWVFPVEGYGARAIGGVKGNGYISKGYDYFDGNKHGGHPAHDIFITDRNQDERDDVTGKPVNVLSTRNGIVVAVANEWAVESELRGGRYIYVFEPATNSLIYYAHNGEIFVNPGDIVKAGDVLATVGRSGKNAHASRSPTHLHIMWLVCADGYPRPKDIYRILLKTRAIR